MLFAHYQRGRNTILRTDCRQFRSYRWSRFAAVGRQLPIHRCHPPPPKSAATRRRSSRSSVTTPTRSVDSARAQSSDSPDQQELARDLRLRGLFRFLRFLALPVTIFPYALPNEHVKGARHTTRGVLAAAAHCNRRDSARAAGFRDSCRLPLSRITAGATAMIANSDPRPHVDVTETGTRDGFQSEPTLIPPEVKAEVIDGLIAAGLRSIEATSFVSPRAVPQLADAHADVVAGKAACGSAHQRACAQRARRRAGAGRGRGRDRLLRLGERDAQQGQPQQSIDGRSQASLKWRRSSRQRVPFAARWPPRLAVPSKARSASTRFCTSSRATPGWASAAPALGDTTGMATPRTVARLVEAIGDRFPAASACAALSQHARRRACERDGRARARHPQLRILDRRASSGCPFAPGATATLHRSTRVPARRISSTRASISMRSMAVAQRVQEVIGSAVLPGQVMRAGPRLRKYRRRRRDARRG